MTIYEHVEFLRRKILLKRQLVKLVGKEITELQHQLATLNGEGRIRSTDEK